MGGGRGGGEGGSVWQDRVRKPRGSLDNMYVLVRSIALPPPPPPAASLSLDLRHGWLMVGKVGQDMYR